MEFENENAETNMTLKAMAHILNGKTNNEMTEKEKQKRRKYGCDIEIQCITYKPY